MNYPIPEIYVLWHPACPLGEVLARRIYAWLRPGSGLGPQVYYRSMAAPEAPVGGLPPALPEELRAMAVSPIPQVAGGTMQISNVQIVLMLIDEHLIADVTWRYWLTSLVLQPAVNNKRVFLPVALDATAFNLPYALREFNFLRPTGLPLPQNDPPGPTAALEIVVRSLLKQLTEALCRLLLGGRERPLVGNTGVPHTIAEGSTPKITIFLSHAKADGTMPARRIRDYIYSQTQLAAFYDENDIPFGAAFSRVLEANIGSSNQTAALIAVRSARYATRPWCRREFATFRHPRQEQTSPGDAERWTLNPTIIVDALDEGSQTFGLPEFGNAPVFRWAEEAQNPEEQVVTTILRDTLLASFHAAVGSCIPAAPDSIVLNWLPDPTTLLHIPRIRAATEDLRILYPGRGLSGLELDILDEFFPRLTLHSFEAVVS